MAKVTPIVCCKSLTVFCMTVIILHEARAITWDLSTNFWLSQHHCVVWLQTNKQTRGCGVFFKTKQTQNSLFGHCWKIFWTIWDFGAPWDVLERTRHVLSTYWEQPKPSGGRFLPPRPLLEEARLISGPQVVIGSRHVGSHVR